MPLLPGHVHTTPPAAPHPCPTHPPSTHTRNPGVAADLSCHASTASAQSPSWVVISSPRSLMHLSDFPASTLIGTQAPRPTCLLLMGPASVLHPPSLSPQSLHSQDPPLASYSLGGHPSPLLSSGPQGTISLPRHDLLLSSCPAPWTGLPAPTGQFLPSLPLVPFSLASCSWLGWSNPLLVLEVTWRWKAPSSRKPSFPEPCWPRCRLHLDAAGAGHSVHPRVMSHYWLLPESSDFG